MTLLQHSILPKFEIRPALLKMAAHFSPDEAVTQRIVERTISVTCDDPALLDGRRVNEALFRIVLVIAREEVGWSAKQ